MRQLYLGLLASVLFLFCVFPQTSSGQDVGEVVIERAEFFSQCTTNIPDPSFDKGHSVRFDVYPAFSGSVLSATGTAPGGASFPLDFSGDDFNANPSLASAALKGSYTFNVTTVAETQTLKVSLPGLAKGIPPLRIANYSDSQIVDASQDFILRWDKTKKFGLHDYIFFNVFDTNGSPVFSSPKIELSQTGALIPAGTLQPNTSYKAYLYLRHYFSLKNSKLPFSSARELHATRFTLKTLNPAGVFQFGPNPVLANEQDGTASMVVQRTQGSHGDVSVDYFTSDRSAKFGVNYSSTAGTLDFPDGVTNQTITVPLLNDGVAASPLTFLLTLTNATAGAGVVTRPHASVTILDSQSAAGPDMNGYLLAKVEFYSQSGGDLPSQSNLCTAARFYASIRPKFPGVVTNASLQLPKHGTLILNNDHDFVEYDADFPSSIPLNKMFAGGKYRLNFSTLAGSFSPTLTLGTEKKFPVPYVTNGAALGSVDSSMPLTLGWNSFTGATSNDFVLFSLRNASGEYLIRTPSEFEPGALPGATPAITIPANTLASGQDYLGNLIFSKVAEGKEVYPGIRNGVASVHTTSFKIHTTSPEQPARVEIVSPQNQDADCPCQTGFQLPVPANSDL